MKLTLRDSRLASVGLASVIAVGVIGIGSVAMAQEGSGDTTAPSAQTAPDPAGNCLARGPRLAAHGLLKDSGVTPEEAQEAAAAGLTNAQMIDQYGDTSSAQAKADALAALETRLTDAVANGKITQEQADTILADAPARIDEFLAAPALAPGDGMKHGFGGIAGNVVATVAGVLGIDEESLKAELREGNTIAEIAGDQTQAVIDALVAEANAKIDQAVADGKITQERADAMKANTVERITTLVNEGGPIGRGGHRGGPGGGMRGAPGMPQGFGGGNGPYGAQ
ncbi:MAG: hypothetical protein KJ048_09860 [Dehalococcoidia bacterium]|nr:hypothetical protein [Dehalococcoidia bacterium]